MFWKHRRLAAGVLAALLVAASLVACSSGKGTNDAVTVKIKGGAAAAYRLGDITVRTTQGSVARDATLSLVRPRTLRAGEAPFDVNAVKFDLSLDGGKLQPAEPLEVSVPLKGAYLPPGAEAPEALLYTPNPSGNGLEMVPAVVDGNGVLHARLYHLSPKIIAYAGDEEMLQWAGIRPVVESKPDCKTAVTANAGQVQFTTAKGWSAKPDSPIQACLDVKDGQAQLSITNRVRFLMAVATTNGLTLSKANAGTEDEVVARLAQLIFPDKRIKAYVGQNATLSTPLPSSSLPATVELVADPSSFLAQVGWSAAKFIIALRTAKSGAELDELAGKIMDAPEVIDCLRSAMSASGGNTPSALKLFEAVASACTNQIGKQVGQLTPDPASWNLFWDILFGGAQTIHQTLVSTLTGITMQFVGTLRVGVSFVQPQATCPSDEILLDAARKRTGYTDESRISAGTKICEGSWAYARVQWYMPDTFGGWSDPVHVILRNQGGTWQLYSFGGTERLEDDECAPLPPKIVAKACP